MALSSGREPEPDCSLCPRLVDWRESARAAEPQWHNAPVPNFAAPDVRALIVGLAPGLRGANRTGRPFTGDFAGDLLYATLLEFGFADGEYRGCAEDNLRLKGCAITNAVRCAPPQNKPTPREINTCRPFLAATIAALPDLCAIVALGRIAHESAVRALGWKLSSFPFAHGVEHVAPRAAASTISVFDSYHCSRYNTNTGVLTAQMFRGVFAKLREKLDVRAETAATDQLPFGESGSGSGL